jgi:hypothetical protein
MGSSRHIRQRKPVSNKAVVNHQKNTPVGTANMFSTGSKGPSTAATVSDERSA